MDSIAGGGRWAFGMAAAAPTPRREFLRLASERLGAPAASLRIGEGANIDGTGRAPMAR